MKTIKLVSPLLFIDNHLQTSSQKTLQRGMISANSNVQKIETSSYPRRPRHVHHTVTVRDWLYLYLQYGMSKMPMSMRVL